MSTYIGTSGSDSLLGSTGRDYISTYEGNDTLDGGNDSSVDTLVGGTGDDTYQIHNNSDIIIDSLGTDVIQLAADFSLKEYKIKNNSIETLDASLLSMNMVLIGNNNYDKTIIAGSGNDSLVGGKSYDILEGGSGDDTLYGGNDSFGDSLVGGDGDDTYIIKDSNDTISDTSGTNTIKFAKGFVMNSEYEQFDLDNDYRYNKSQISIIDASALSRGFAQLSGNYNMPTTIIGSSGNDNISGGSSSDSLFGGKGKDILDSGWGFDMLDGGIGNDSLYGGHDEDELFGGSGNDLLVGDDGERYQFNQNYNDTLYGGDGNDFLTEAVYYDGGSGNDTFYVYDTSGITIVDSSGKDSVITYGASQIQSIAAFADVENLAISQAYYNYIIYGNSKNNILVGSGGADTLGGTDSLVSGSGAGNDTLYGSSGDDVYYVNNSGDRVKEYADEGTDTVIIDGEYNAPSFSLSANVENLDLSEITGVTKKMTINGNSSGNKITSNDTYGNYFKIYAGAGNDTVYGGSASDYIEGGTGDDLIYGYSGADTILGGSGDDLLNGGAGNDSIVGGVGSDNLYGGAGNDVLTGGSGHDIYSFNAGDGLDIITATDFGDIIVIDADISDLFFYTDIKKNLYIDYTDGTGTSVGNDAIEILKGKYNSSTAIWVGDHSISVNSVIQAIGSTAASGVTDVLTVSSETISNQQLTLTWTT